MGIGDSTAFNLSKASGRAAFARGFGCLDDAIADDKKYGNGPVRSPLGTFARWPLRCPFGH